MPRFVILEHDHPELHWDLMLEAGAVLLTWRLARPPEHAGQWIAATALPDHRPMYLDYEGPVRGERGFVRRWDFGSYAEAEDTQPDVRRFFLDGAQVRGIVRLDRIVGDEWQFQWRPASDR